ncbi:cell wall-binding repeat-containing protein [Romboutsia lituseburensis]|uniref:Putative cell wall binding repeat 2 n=1 Tax=Romboutsia lituseburensis DSM 797 TaxID=1121325 RepID=A0A1G9QMG3_9FIRM|nr:cell wall-binding repeat-containing protein [Romboutsia lituseburensis]CEH35590.1 Cell surface protein [Romboutsia lituseburensis]SDM12209.1 Putative cell wall binding repeat 2 [Romboutsia lituseburensis DSM 797]
MSKRAKMAFTLIIILAVCGFGIKFYLDENYLSQYNRKQIIGLDRFETMTKISEIGWKKSDEAVLVSIHSVIDGVSASSFAYQKNIPIFFTDSEEINSTVKDEIKRLGVKKVYLIGGDKVITNDIKKELKKMNINSERIGGESGFETSILLAEKVNKLNPISEVVLVNMRSGKPNGVAIAPAAANRNIPVLMVNKSDRKETLKFLKEHNIKKVYLTGSETAFPDVFEAMLKDEKYGIKADVVRLNGEDRYETNKEIIKEFYDLDKINHIYILRNGIYNYGDLLNALALSPIAAKENTPILYSADSLQKTEEEFLQESNVKNITEVGFELVRPRIITDKIIRFISSITIVVVWILALKRIIYNR